MIKSLICQSYGQHKERHLSFSSGLTIVIGSNEAGKSTLKSALFDILYGFQPASTDKHPYAPWSNAPIALASELKHGKVVRHLEGKTVKGEWITQHQKKNINNKAVPELSQISRHGFNEIYTIDLYDLSAISDKTWQEVEGMWVSKSNYYTLKPTQTVDKEWKESIDALWRPRKKTGVIIRGLEHEKEQALEKKHRMDQQLKEREAISERLSKYLTERSILEERLASYQEAGNYLHEHQESYERYQQYVRYLDIGDPLPTCFRQGQLSTYKEERVKLLMYRQELDKHQSHYDRLMLKVAPLSQEEQVIYKDKASIKEGHESYQMKRDDYARHKAMLDEKELALDAMEPVRSGNKPLAYGALTIGVLSLGISYFIERLLPYSLILGLSLIVVAFYLMSRVSGSTKNQGETLQRECDILRERLSSGPPQSDDRFLQLQAVEAKMAQNKSLQSQVLEATGQIDYYQGMIKTVEKKTSVHRKTLKVLGHHDLEQGLVIVEKLYEESIAYHQAMEQWDRVDEKVKHEIIARHNYVKDEGEKHKEAISTLAKINEEEESFRLRLLELPSFEEGESIDAEVTRLTEALQEAYRNLDQLLMLRELLAMSDESFKKVYQPIIIEGVSRYMSSFTGGKYQSFIRDEAGLLHVEVDGHYRSVDDGLSQGLRDLLYLSLKLSIIDALGEKEIPLVLDEVWVNLDQLHREQLIKVLSECARERQIIMMTCHPDWVNSKEGIHIVKMSE